VSDVKSRSLLSWLGIFVAGFICGVVFSAWKLDRHSAPISSTAPAISEEDTTTGVRSRIAGLEKMLAVNPNNVDALVQLGNDYFDTGNYEKAVETYQRSLRIDQRNADVITDMGISYRKLGKSKEAVDAFRKALEVDPNHAMALFNLGLVLRDDLKDYAGALKAWEAFLQKAGDSRYAVMVRPWVKQLKEKLGSGSAPGASPADK
jgi:cytochrome c-type biogenesis protein CcmH/NrfG